MGGPRTTHEDFESIKSVLDVQACVGGSLRGHFGRRWIGRLVGQAEG